MHILPMEDKHLAASWMCHLKGDWDRYLATIFWLCLLCSMDRESEFSPAAALGLPPCGSAADLVVLLYSHQSPPQETQLNTAARQWSYSCPCCPCWTAARLRPSRPPSSLICINWADVLEAPPTARGPGVGMLLVTVLLTWSNTSSCTLQLHSPCLSTTVHIPLSWELGNYVKKPVCSFG